MKQSKQAFKERVRKWAQKVGVEIHTISIRQMKNKWASFTKHSSLLIFNIELLDMDKALGDQVIVHELLHSARAQSWQIVEESNASVSWKLRTLGCETQEKVIYQDHVGG